MKEDDLILAGQQTAEPVDDSEDSSMLTAISLPTFEDMTDQKILKEVKTVFKGFDYNEAEDPSKIFSTPEQMAEYMLATMKEIQDKRFDAQAAEVQTNAAAMARFWYMGKQIDEALSKGDYGTAAVNKIATKLEKSVPYVYKIRAVATKLTVTECYLLGIRGISSTKIRALSQVRDDATRKAIIAAFIEAVPDTSDVKKLATAQKLLTAAINSDAKANTIEVTTSDPNTLDKAEEIIGNPTYSALVDQFRSMKGLLKKLEPEETLETFCGACADFYIMADEVDAQDRCDAIIAEATALKELAKTVITNITDLDTQLDSIINGVKPLENNEAPKRKKNK